MLKKIISLMFVTLSFMVFIGCSSTGKKVPYCCKHMVDNQKAILYLQDQLAQEGAKVYFSDNKVRVVLPSSKMFVKNSANFIPSAYKLLDLSLSLARYYSKTTVAVIGYPKDPYSLLEKGLAAEKSKLVLRYLWRNKIDSNFNYAKAAQVEVKTGSAELNSVVFEFLYQCTQYDDSLKLI